MQGFLFDTSVWVALTFQAHPLHAAAQGALANATVDRKALFCRSTQQSYLRLTSSPNMARQYGVPSVSNRQAFDLLEVFLARPVVGFVEEPANILPRWKVCADLPTSSPKRWMDAYLAAFAMEADLEFVSADNDFKVFRPALRLVSIP